MRVPLYVRVRVCACLFDFVHVSVHVCVCVWYLSPLPLFWKNHRHRQTDERNREGPTVTCDPEEDAEQVEKTVKQGSDNTGTQLLGDMSPWTPASL